MAMPPQSMQAFRQGSYLSAGSDGYLEDLYNAYLSNPESVSAEWRDYFDALLKAMPREVAEVSHEAVQEALKSPAMVLESLQMAADQKQEHVLELIDAYRRVGHLKANIDPLGLREMVANPVLDLSYYGFTPSDLSQNFSVASFSGLNKESASLNEIFAALNRVYSHTIGFEYMHINRPDEVEWLRDRIEKGWSNFDPSADEKRYLLNRLIVADGLEKYLGFKYIGQKRFSLEGGDSLIPMLDTLIARGVQHGVKEAIIGMAHRGRLNVLVNVVGQAPNKIFAAFEGKGISQTHSGDVKYHLGYAGNVETKNGLAHVTLAFNPSHLEIVSPVVQGSVRARQRRRKDKGQQQVIPIQIHGDAAFAGQGVVMETFNMSQARWFTVGGSIHIVINNQVGFTISNPQDSRSTIYCTDVAKMVEAPIFHVNADDPIATYFAALLAMDYRHTFKRDVVIDLVCYRRHGHNEADEPSATQPLMYQVIKAKPPIYVTFAEQLREAGVIDAQFTETLVNEYRADLDQGKTVVKVSNDKIAYEFLSNWEPYVEHHWSEKVDTGVPPKQLKALAMALDAIPADFQLQPQVKKVMDAKIQMTAGKMPVNWGYAENLAYAALLAEGYPIRLCGQDAARGTFAHRHSVLHDQATDQIYIPLSHVSANQAQINIVDSLLSEEAVLAFEYGYATAEPNYLVIWEAQFGDFANGAQVVIDQFISSGEQKWGRLCGLVMLLPHGYEGQGPEHSSARLERYLQLCAQENIQVCVPTLPSQIFHLLRRQMIRPYRKPLVVMTPKGLLRNPMAVSSFQDLAEGRFQLIIPEVDDLTDAKVERIIFCSGKVYYELLNARREQKLNHIAIVRVEQLYPFPETDCKKQFKKYKSAKEVVWCQEEPQNQGAWTFVQRYLHPLLAKNQSLYYAGRKASASPAAGYHQVHESEQKKLVSDALKKLKENSNGNRS